MASYTDLVNGPLTKNVHVFKDKNFNQHMFTTAKMTMETIKSISVEQQVLFNKIFFLIKAPHEHQGETPVF